MDYSRIKQKNISLESSIEDGVTVFGNYELLQRLVNNLKS